MMPQAFQAIAWGSPAKVPEPAPPPGGRKGGFPDNQCYVKQGRFLSGVQFQTDKGETAKGNAAPRNSQKFESPWRLPLPMGPRLSFWGAFLFVTDAAPCMYITPLGLAIPAPGGAPGAGIAFGGGKGTFFLSFFIRRRVSTFNQAFRSYQDSSASAFVWQAGAWRAIAEP